MYAKYYSYVAGGFSTILYSAQLAPLVSGQMMVTFGHTPLLVFFLVKKHRRGPAAISDHF